MKKNSLLARLGLILTGVVLALLLMEIGLRTTGKFLSLGRESRNRQNLSGDTNYRILCLGESTTESQWPPFLQRALDQNAAGRKFKVIDEGRAGTSSGAILSRLEEYLDRYKPHMVVVMMGINDGTWIWRNPVAFNDKPETQLSLFLRSFRLNKLAHYIIGGLDTHATRFDIGDFEAAESAFKTAIKQDPGNSHHHVALGHLYHKTGRQRSARMYFESGIKINPADPHAYSALGNLHREDRDYESAERVFHDGIKRCPDSVWLHNDMGDLYRETGRLREAMAMYETAIRIDANDPRAYMFLGGIHFAKGRLDNAAEIYERGLRFSPKHQDLYFALAKVYSVRGELDKLEKLYEAGIAQDPAVPWISSELGKLPRRNRGGSARAVNSGLAIKPYPVRATVVNYQKLRDVVLGRGIKLVCMQYPLRDGKVLKEILGADKGILFVENKRNFEVILENRSIADVFRDMFAGDFGHCTDLGNKLIADTLSEEILKGVAIN